MIKLLIGHRGVGKSTLLKRIKTYFPDHHTFDLDEEIEKATNQTIAKIFKISGEAHFRTLEESIFKKIVAENKDCWIALGAGFNLSLTEKDQLKIWVRRKTDKLGRIFSNRPRLNQKLAPLQEYNNYFEARNKIYSHYADRQHLIPEGMLTASEVEKSILAENFQAQHATLTLQSKNIYCAKLNFSYFELRDDLLSCSEINDLLKIVYSERIIYSTRNKELRQPLVSDFLHWDWPHEFGANSEASIISLHQRKESIEETIKAFDQQVKIHQHQKLAVEINDFNELKYAFRWQQENPTGRSLLPNSTTGRWGWVRLYLKGRQLLNFVRVDEGTSLDQPTLFEWLQSPSVPTEFSAVLGQPVEHSFSPQFHASRFTPFWPIEIRSAEFSSALGLLDDWGLKNAAVTSPLKDKAYGVAQDLTAIAEELQSVNTLRKKNKIWSGHNTDYEGLSSVANGFKNKSIAIWGGGGTLNMLKKLFPQAQCLSVRTGKDRLSNLPPQECEVLIWAARPEDVPPLDLRGAKTVIDLNYREDSKAKEFALEIGAEYISGNEMFYAQARAQQEFWSV